MEEERGTRQTEAVSRSMTGLFFKGICLRRRKAEWQELTAKKKAACKEYRAARSTMQEVLTVKANIDALLGDTRQEKNKEQER